MKTKAKTKKPAPAFRVGDRVTVPFAHGTASAIVIEERGMLGIDGQYLYYVHIPMEPYDPMFMAFNERQLSAATDDPAPIGPAEAAEYLVNGGLGSILYQNIAGGQNQPVAWLCRSTSGLVTHTFRAERGMVGGRLVPVAALHGNKVAKDKAEAVTAFVESFGVSRQEAERVVAAVGIAR